MCSVVVRWSPGGRLLILALRDELVGRSFDDPDYWWPDQPTVVGGRDHQAGGTWCATDVATGATALVLNRAQRAVAAPGAPSRGVLPLLAVRHPTDWPEHIDLQGMASFALVVVTPSEGIWQWEFDGADLLASRPSAGTHMFTAGRHEQGRAAKYLPLFAATHSPERWRALVTDSIPTADPTSLLVDRQSDGSTFATVFAQLISAGHGALELSWTRTPAAQGTWNSAHHTAPSTSPLHP